MEVLPLGCNQDFAKLCRQRFDLYQAATITALPENSVLWACGVDLASVQILANNAQLLSLSMRPRQDSRREPEIILPVTRDMKRVVHGFGERDPFIAAHEPACFHVTTGTIWAPILLALVIAIAAAVMLILLFAILGLLVAAAVISGLLLAESVVYGSLASRADRGI
jgi:hypothetical protein